MGSGWGDRKHICGTTQCTSSGSSHSSKTPLPYCNKNREKLKTKTKPDMYRSSKIQKPKRPLLQQQMRKQIKFKTRHVWQQNPETSKTQFPFTNNTAKNIKTKSKTCMVAEFTKTQIHKPQKTPLQKPQKPICLLQTTDEIFCNFYFSHKLKPVMYDIDRSKNPEKPALI